MHAQNTLFAGTRKGDIVDNLGTAGCTAEESPPSVVPKIAADMHTSEDMTSKRASRRTKTPTTDEATNARSSRT